MLKIGVIIAGCGAQDGTEIHEAVITLLALDKAGVKVIIMAPDMDQFHVINHFNHETEDQSRNTLVEASRIARGEIIPVSAIGGEEIDALIFPGGTGMAKNIFDYAMVGSDCNVIPDVQKLTIELLESGKPIGAICIAPVMIAKILQSIGKNGILTGGYDKKITKDIEIMGIDTKQVGAKEIVVDELNKIVSTPAYVETNSIAEVAIGVEKLVKKIIEMI